MEGLAFDPAMFGMKADHGTKDPAQERAQELSNGHPPQTSHRNTGGSSRGRGRGGNGRGFGRGANSGALGDRGSARGMGPGRGRGGNRGGSGGQHQAKRPRMDNNERSQGSRGFFKPSMMEDPWAHLA